MKKLILCAIMLLFILGTAGCSKEDVKLTADNVTTNTILAKSNGVLQVATIEEFNKPYYNLNELEDFIANEVAVYNKAAGEQKVTIEDVKLNDGKAVLLLTYSGMDQYANFNDAVAAYFNGGVSEVPLDLPATLVSEKNGSLASTQEIIGNNKLKILVMNEPYEIIVDGTIKYYSENATYVDDNKVQGATEGMTIVVFKP
jgi:hypothetical protein